MTKNNGSGSRGGGSNRYTNTQTHKEKETQRHFATNKDLSSQSRRKGGGLVDRFRDPSPFENAIQRPSLPERTKKHNQGINRTRPNRKKRPTRACDQRLRRNQNPTESNKSQTSQKKSTSNPDPKAVTPKQNKTKQTESHPLPLTHPLNSSTHSPRTLPPIPRSRRTRRRRRCRARSRARSPRRPRGSRR